jgi:DNA-binding CsgD family transcriptional regulator
VRTRMVLVAHRHAMVAEGIAAGLARVRGIVPLRAVTSSADAERHGETADGVVLDRYMAAAESTANRLRAKGVRVVMLGEGSEEEDGVWVSASSSIATLAGALVPETRVHRAAPSRLSAREKEILTLVGRGLAGKQVARHLGISPKTVEHHKTRIFSKLGAANQAAAVRLAAEEELRRGDSWTRLSI